MIQKEISLWVLEDEQPVKKPLVELLLTSPVNYRIVPETYDLYWSMLGVNFEPYHLVDEYLQTTSKISSLFLPLFAPNSTFPLYEKIMAAGVAFANADAYAQKTKHGFNNDEEDTIKVEGIAHFHPKEGVVFSLEKRLSLADMTYIMIHEQGHYLDYILNPRTYGSKTATMREMMAIFVSERFGKQKSYCKGTSHYRAQKLLRKLDGTSFVAMTFAEQWEFLTGLLDHQQAPYYFKNHLQNRLFLDKIFNRFKDIMIWKSYIEIMKEIKRKK